MWQGERSWQRGKGHIKTSFCHIKGHRILPAGSGGTLKPLPTFMLVFRDTVTGVIPSSESPSIHKPLWLPPAVKAENRRRALGSKKYQHFYRLRSSRKLKTACLVLWKPTQRARTPLTGTLSAPELARHGTIPIFFPEVWDCFLQCSFVPGTCHQWSVRGMLSKHSRACLCPEWHYCCGHLKPVSVVADTQPYIFTIKCKTRLHPSLLM